MPLFTAAIAAIGVISTFLATLGPVTSFLLKTAVGIGVNLLLQSLAGKPKPPVFSIQTKIKIGGDLPREFPMGRTMVSGSLVWANTRGTDSNDTPNAYLYMVIALSDLPVRGLADMYVFGEKVTLEYDETNAAGGLKYDIPEYDKDGRNLWVTFYDGNQTQADPELVSRFDSGSRVYSANRIGYGIAYAVVKAKVSNNMFSGLPECKFILDGIPLYDPTQADEAGGDGDYEYGDPSTWTDAAADRLPAVQAYNLLRGLYYNGQWVYGMQNMSANRLPLDNWMEQIDKCRNQVPNIDNSGTEDEFRSSALIPYAAPIGNTLEAINTTCGGRISEVGGIYSMTLGAPEPPTFSFTDDDILDNYSESFTPFYGLADSVTGIHANYPDEDLGWEMTAAPPIYRADLEAQIGGRRALADVDLNFVPYRAQVIRLMNSTVAEAERARRHTLTLPAAFWAYAVPGATCQWTSAKNGYTTKQFRVDGAVDKANLDVLIDFTEVDPNDFVPPDEYEPAPSVPMGPIRPPSQAIVDFFAEGSTVTGDNGRVRPAIELTWDGDKPDIIGVQFQIRKLAEPDIIVYQGSTEDYLAGSILISANIFSNTNYQARAKYIPGSERDTSYSGWINCLTPDIQDNDVAITFASLGAEVRDLLTDIRNDAANMRSKLQQLATSTLEGTRQAAHSNLVVAKANGALAVAFQELTATVNEFDDEIAAIATATTALEATVGDTEAGILWRMVAQAGTGDVVSRVVLQVRASVGDVWVDAATVWEAGFVGGNPLAPFGRITLKASEVVIADGEDNITAFFDEDGLFLNNAFITNLTGDHIAFNTLTGNHIVALSIDSPSLAFGAVTDFYEVVWHEDRSGGSPNYDDGSFDLKHEVEIEANIAATPMIEFLTITLDGDQSGSGGIDLYTVVTRDQHNGGDGTPDSDKLVLQLRKQSEGAPSIANISSYRQDGDTDHSYQIWMWNTIISSSNSWNFQAHVDGGVLRWKK